MQIAQILMIKLGAGCRSPGYRDIPKALSSLGRVMAMMGSESMIRSFRGLLLVFQHLPYFFRFSYHLHRKFNRWMSSKRRLDKIEKQSNT
jgi:hypothetical protein